MRPQNLRDSGVWELTAHTADGIDLEPQRLTVRVQLDGRAKIQFLEPSEELEVIATAEVPFVVEAADDLALVRIGIGCQVADGPMQVLWQEEYGEGSSEVVRGTATVRLEDYRLTYQDGVTYYAFADDRYFDDERRTATPLRFIDIRPFKMAYQMLDTGGTCNGIFTTLEELIARQRQNLALTFAAQSEEPVSAKLLQRLTNYETGQPQGRRLAAGGLPR